VEQTLADLDLGGKPRLLVINKMDLLTDDPADVEMFDRIDLSVISGAESPAVGGRVFVSAARGWNLPGLLEAVLDQVGSSVAVSTPATA
jgi:50S ribosomal subunit-associated GTPase HflX